MKNIFPLVICVVLIIVSSCNEDTQQTEKQAPVVSELELQETDKPINTSNAENTLPNESIDLTKAINTKQPTVKTIYTTAILDNNSNNTPTKPSINIYAPFEKNTVVRIINGSKIQSLKFPEGTQLIVPANAFVDKETGKPINDSITIAVKEFYNKKDFLLENLSTMSNGKLLESGGTIHMSATVNGKECKLAQNKSIEIKFPYNQEQKGMEIFHGQKVNNEINWIQNSQTDATLAQPRFNQTIVEDNSKKYTTSFMTTNELTNQVEAQFRGGQKALRLFLEKNVQYPRAALKKRKTGKVNVQLTIDKDGTISEVKCDKRQPSIFVKEAIRLSKMLPKFIPARTNNIATAMNMTLPISFYINSDFVATASAEQYTNKSVVMSIDEFKKQTRQTFDSVKNINELSVNTLGNYSLYTSKLGWINCDRFYRDKRPKIQLAIFKAPNENVNIKLIFSSIKSIMTGYQSSDKYTFDNIPKKEKVTLFALKKIDQQIYLATQTIVTGSKDKINLAYNPIDKENLKKEIEKLCL